MPNYYIEYKSMDFPYDYKYDRQTYKTVTGVRKRCISLIERRSAVLCVIRGGKEQLVYATVRNGYVLEDRSSGKWYHLNKSGTLGTQIRRIENAYIIQSAYQRL